MKPMLLPRYSIRTALGVVTGVAVVSLFAGQAMGGRAWAFGLTFAVLSVPAALAVHAAFFAMASAFSGLLASEDIVARTSRGGVQRSLRVSAHGHTAEPAVTTESPAAGP
jgi:hypothetical protein